MTQSTHRLLMIRPANFRSNEATGDNAFQNAPSGSSDVQTQACEEFDCFVDELRNKGIHVFVRNSREEDDTPDALFPNNWVSFHEDGRAAIYPMMAENRRRERREGLIEELCDEFGLKLEEIADFTEFESHQKFLEGTGSMVLDRVQKICYAALSERTDEHAVELFAEYFGYEACCFKTSLKIGDTEKPVYHTNVVMSIGSKFAVIADECIPSPDERAEILMKLEQSGKQIIRITNEQLAHFCGNILEVLNEEGSTYIAMSQTAWNHFSADQQDALQQFGEIITVPLPIIEHYGGGSARCMLCEVFLPKL